MLGSVITSRADERRSYEHRIAASWACYWRWQHILECQADINIRIKFWMLTVGRSMLYGLASTRENSFNQERLAITQRNMVRRMLKLKRKPIGWIDNGTEKQTPILEQWVEWQVRTLRRSADEIRLAKSSIVIKLIEERSSWAGHVARFGLGTRESHILKNVILRRNVFWWKTQMWFNDLGSHTHRLVHNADVGVLRRWEWSLPEDWLEVACKDVAEGEDSGHS